MIKELTTTDTEVNPTCVATSVATVQLIANENIALAENENRQHVVGGTDKNKILKRTCDEFLSPSSSAFSDTQSNSSRDSEEDEQYICLDEEDGDEERAHATKRLKSFDSVSLHHSHQSIELEKLLLGDDSDDDDNDDESSGSADEDFFNAFDFN